MRQRCFQEPYSLLQYHGGKTQKRILQFCMQRSASMDARKPWSRIVVASFSPMKPCGFTTPWESRSVRSRRADRGKTTSRPALTSSAGWPIGTLRQLKAGKISLPLMRSGIVTTITRNISPTRRSCRVTPPAMKKSRMRRRCSDTEIARLLCLRARPRD
jgi:hypothetical protein